MPLFPLRTVLFPGGSMPLKIFEQRYLSMVRECTGNDSGFGICMIREGEEAVAPVKPARIGTLAHIVDWFTLEDGLLGVSTVGTIRFVTENIRRRKNGLFMGQISWLPEPPLMPVPEAFSVLSAVLARFMENLGNQYPEYTPDHLQDASWVGYRLSELLPLASIEKQHMLELSDPLDRLQSLLDILPRFQT
ncbi:MAG: peptidase S16 [Chloroflexota bacterium]|nr:MAG: peptidase S16 [Chloroflexota bacterium]